MTALLDVPPATLGVSAAALPLALHETGYLEPELLAWLDEDAVWRERNPHVVGGPLRNSKGQMAPVPAFMRLDYYTDRDGPVSGHRPDLGPCWIFTGGLNKGYGYIRVGKRKVQAYRLNYERYVGPIPDGLLMDHLCRVRACVHPHHVEPTTYRENVRRSPVHGAMAKAARDRCPADHLFDEANTRWHYGTRYCRACQAEQKRRRTGADPRRLSTNTHCANGHSWEGNLSVLPSGKRQCATCNRDAGQRFRQRRRDAKAVTASVWTPSP